MDQARIVERDEATRGALALRVKTLWRARESAVGDAWAEEAAYRRLSLWLAVAAGAGVVLYFCASHEPALPLCIAAVGVAGVLAFLSRHHRRAFALFLVLACVAGGFAAAAWRTARVAAPVLSRTAFGELTGFVEELDLRRAGGRFVLRVASAEGVGVVPFRVRLTTRGEPDFAAGDFIALKARLSPPAHAALPGGYDFARDAFFSRIGAVGATLGRIEKMAPPNPPPMLLRFFASVDRARNALALRVYHLIEGDAGAIAAAMVTGKRDFLSEDAKALIRKAGIFHIITISGVQMTLVAGIFFVGLRRLLAMSRTLALNYPIKKWASSAAILGAIAYDIFTGSRVGADRALVMTLIMLTAVLFDRPSLSMRNLAISVVVVIAFEPEALLGASFQLSFAAVAALIAVYEWRSDAMVRRRAVVAAPRSGPIAILREALAGHMLHGPGAAVVATLCATSATASFMANDFHELSPYVLVGNPLTLAVIEFFAVPCALLGAALYPFGLDSFVWRYLKMGIDLVMSLAGVIASAPGASLPVKAFSPWAIVFLTLAVLSVVLWRTRIMRATAIPFALIGLLGVRAGAPFDLAVAATGEAAALREPTGSLIVLGKRPSMFDAEQWLRADADPRTGAEARGASSCDESACVGRAPDGRVVSLVQDRRALIEDCARAAVLITSLSAPEGCAAPIVIDRDRLAETGAVTLRFSNDGAVWTRAREIDEDRPWSPAPKPRRKSAAMMARPTAQERDAEDTQAMEPLP